MIAWMPSSYLMFYVYWVYTQILWFNWKKIELAYVNTFKFINKPELKRQLNLMCDAYL